MRARAGARESPGRPLDRNHRWLGDQPVPDANGIRTAPDVRLEQLLLADDRDQLVVTVHRRLREALQHHVHQRPQPGWVVGQRRVPVDRPSSSQHQLLPAPGPRQERQRHPASEVSHSSVPGGVHPRQPDDGHQAPDCSCLAPGAVRETYSAPARRTALLLDQPPGLPRGDGDEPSAREPGAIDGILAAVAARQRAPPGLNAPAATATGSGRSPARRPSRPRPAA